MCTKRRAVLQFRHCVEWFAKKEILNSHKKKKVHSVVKHSQRTYIKYVHHVQIHKGQHKFLVVFRKKIEFLTACRLVKEKSWGVFLGGGGDEGLQHAQQEFARPVRMLPGDLRYWALVLVTAPCFCRRWSLSWLLCLKWRSHFSH